MESTEQDWGSNSFPRWPAFGFRKKPKTKIWLRTIEATNDGTSSWTRWLFWARVSHLYWIQLPVFCLQMLSVRFRDMLQMDGGQAAPDLILRSFNGNLSVLLLRLSWVGWTGCCLAFLTHCQETILKCNSSRLSERDYIIFLFSFLFCSKWFVFISPFSLSVLCLMSYANAGALWLLTSLIYLIPNSQIAFENFSF